MRYKRTKRFSELDSSGNWAGLGKDKFTKLEAGKTVSIKTPPKELVDKKYIKKIGANNGN